MAIIYYIVKSRTETIEDGGGVIEHYLHLMCVAGPRVYIYLYCRNYGIAIF